MTKADKQLPRNNFLFVAKKGDLEVSVLKELGGTVVLTSRNPSKIADFLMKHCYTNRNESTFIEDYENKFKDGGGILYQESIKILKAKEKMIAKEVKRLLKEHKNKPLPDWQGDVWGQRIEENQQCKN